MQRVTRDTGYEFAGVEKLLQETFLPRLFFGKSKFIPSVVGTLSTMPVKKYRPGLQNPVKSSNEKYLSDLHARSEMIGSIAGDR